jgi:hypothetical protein
MYQEEGVWYLADRAYKGSVYAKLINTAEVPRNLTGKAWSIKTESGDWDSVMVDITCDSKLSSNSSLRGSL